MAVIDSGHRTKVVNAICNSVSTPTSQWVIPVIYGSHKTGDPDRQLLPQDEKVGDPSRPFMATHRNFVVGGYVDMLTDDRGLVELPHGVPEEVVQHYLANEMVREPDAHGIMQNKWVKKRDSTGFGGGKKGRVLEDDYFAAGCYCWLAALELGLESVQSGSIGEAQEEADRVAEERSDMLRRSTESGAARRARLSARIRRHGLTSSQR